MVQQPENHEDKHVEQASGFYYKLKSGKTIVSLVTLKIYLAELYHLNKELQLVNINWLDAEHEIKRTSCQVVKITDDEILQGGSRDCAKELGIRGT